MLRFVLIGVGLIVVSGLAPWAFNLLTGNWFSAGQRAKWEARVGAELPPNRIRLMGAGGTLVLLGLLLMVAAIIGISNPAVIVPIGLVLVASGAIVSTWARRRSAA